MDRPVDRLRLPDVVTLCVATLLCLGLLMVQSAAMNVTGYVGWQWTDKGTRHLVYVALALAAFFLVGSIDYAKLRGPAGRPIWRSTILWSLIAAIGLCAIVLVPGIGLAKNGAQRWLPLGPVQVQPSEIAKWAIVLFLAWWLTSAPVDLRRFRILLLTLAPIAAACLLIVIEDFGTAVLIGLCAFAMLLCSRVKKWQLLALIPLVLLAGAWFIMHKDYRVRRMMAFTDPWAAPRTEGYHMVQSLLSFSTGGLTGKGIGNGVQKLGYLPEDTTDFIFAVICEELGLFGAMLVISMYLGIAFVAWQVIKSRRDSFGQMLAFGVAGMICLQAVINIAVATVSVPTKGLSLPLVSAGGSGLVIACAALGLLRSVCRFEHDEPHLAATAKVEPVENLLAPPVRESDWRSWTVPG